MSGMTFAVSEEAFQSVFEALRDQITLAGTIGPGDTDVSAQVDYDIQLKRGRIALNSNNTLTVSELDLTFMKFDLTLYFNIDPICVGGGYIVIDIPYIGEVKIPVPSWCVFEDDPDFQITIPAGEILKHLVHEVSFTARLGADYAVSKARRRGKDYLEAHDKNDPNLWRIFIMPMLPIDIDLLDVADTVGDFLESAVEAALDSLLSGLGETAKAAITALLGSVIDVIRDVLDITDDIEEWIENLIRFDLDVLDHILMAVVRSFRSDFPLLTIEDPYPVLPEHDHKIVESGGVTYSTLCEVMLPVTGVGIEIGADEMVIEAGIGEVIL